MKRTTSSRSLTSKQVQEAIAAAPDSVTDANTPYDPNDAASITKFWKGAVVTKGGGVAAVTADLATRRRPGQRGIGKRQPKVAINIRLSPEVLDAFKSTGEGWQTRVDCALERGVRLHWPRAPGATSLARHQLSFANLPLLT